MTNSEPGTGVLRGQVSIVECGEGCLDDFEGQTVEKLFVFIRSSKAQAPRANQRLWGSAPNPGVYRIRANGSRESIPSPERGSLFGEPIAPSGLLGLLSSIALSVPAVSRTGNNGCQDARRIVDLVKYSTFAQFNFLHFCSVHYRNSSQVSRFNGAHDVADCWEYASD